MIYSVWNPRKREYTYFEHGDDDPSPPVPKLRSHGLGLTPDEVAWPLPVGARRVGSGPVAQGMIAGSGGAALAGITDHPSLLVVGVALAAYLYFRRR